MVTFVSIAQSQKASSSIPHPSGITTSFRPLESKARGPTTLQLSGILTLVKERQPENEHLLISMQPSGIVTHTSELQLQKASIPVALQPTGMETAFSAPQR
jgi:hypothetical protein